jgi:hypothetical protein
VSGGEDDDINLDAFPADIPGVGLERQRNKAGIARWPKEPHAREGARLLAVSRRLGAWLYANLRQRDTCDACGRGPVGELPDAEMVKTFADYGKIVLGLMREQRERVALMLKYKLKRDMSEAEIQAKIREIVALEVETMADDELEAALTRRRAAKERA